MAQRVEWQPAFFDEFDGSSLNLTRWIPRDPLPGNGSTDPSHYSVLNGNLHFSGSAAVSTFGIFAQPFGRFEIRARIQPAAGSHARFRLMPVPLSKLPAITVFDVSGDDPGNAYFGNEWGTPQSERSFGDSVAVPELAAAFHSFTVDWENGRIVWSVDGKQKFKSSEGVPSLPVWLLIEAGGGTVDVDYIRVSRRP